jgi:hypothetical protein
MNRRLRQFNGTAYRRRETAEAYMDCYPLSRERWLRMPDSSPGTGA